jgi:hypothetical protein
VLSKESPFLSAKGQFLVTLVMFSSACSATFVVEDASQILWIGNNLEDAVRLQRPSAQLPVSYVVFGETFCILVDQEGSAFQVDHTELTIEPLIHLPKVRMVAAAYDQAFAVDFKAECGPSEKGEL